MFFMKKLALVSFASGLLVPALAFAQNLSYVNFWIDNGVIWLGRAVSIIMILMTIYFLINVFRYISEKDPGKLADKRKTMISGLVGLFIAVSVWGIINIAQRVFGTQGSSYQTPTVNCPPGTQYITTANGTRACI